jgi:hypothetical protein
MKSVYQTAAGSEAHLIKGVLAQHGVEATVLGEGLGPYAHPIGSVRVVVEPENEAAAREILAAWEAGRSKEETPLRAPRLSRDTVVILIAAAALLAVLWYFTGV